MQVLPVLLAALVAVPGLAPGTGPQAAPEAEGADAEGPAILFEIDNPGPPFGATLFVRTEEREAARRDVTFPAGRSEWPLPIPEGQHAAGVRWEDGSTSSGHSTLGCPGDYRVSYRIEDRFPVEVDPRTGCLARPPAFLALLDEARSAYDARGGNGALHVPLPADGDRGELRLWTDLAPPDWDEAAPFRFSVAGLVSVDEWGRETQGPEVSEVDVGGGWIATASAGLLVTSPPATVENATEAIRFRGGDLTPFAHSRTYVESGSSRDTARAVALRDLQFKPAPASSSCRYRHGLQGQDVEASDRIAAARFCARWSGDEGEWVAGAPREREGLRAMPLYWLREDDEGLRLARVWLADGVAYPVEWESWRQTPEGPIRHAAHRLLSLAPGDGPLPLHAQAPAAAQVALAPLDPLRGPALKEGRGRFPFPLDEASDAARSQPGLDALQELLRRDDAVLAGAHMRVRSEAGAPALVHAWHLVFTAKGTMPVQVLCERPAAPDALALPLPPVARCELVEEPPFFPADLEPPVALGRADLPARAASFDLALARWGALASRTDAPVTYALYRAWDAEDSTGGTLGVGQDVPENVAPYGTGAKGEADVALLHLREGRTLAHVTGVVRASGADTLPERIGVSSGVASDRGHLAGPAPASLPPVVKVGAVLGVTGLGLLALLALFWAPIKSALAALYTRLTRSDVLDSETRARILRLVEEQPGLHTAGVFQALAKGEGVTEYHLRVLVREGLLTCVETKGFRRYFVTGRYSPREMRALAALKEGHAQRVYQIVVQNPGIPLGEVAARADLSLPNASRTVSRLAEAGLLARRKEGRLVRLEADESWRGAGA